MFLPTAAKSAYVNHYQRWLNGLLSEIAFWRSYMETKGLQWHANWEEKISPTKVFPLEKFIPKLLRASGGGIVVLTSAPDLSR